MSTSPLIAAKQQSNHSAAPLAKQLSTSSTASACASASSTAALSPSPASANAAAAPNLISMAHSPSSLSANSEHFKFTLAQAGNVESSSPSLSSIVSPTFVAVENAGASIANVTSALISSSSTSSSTTSTSEPNNNNSLNSPASAPLLTTTTTTNSLHISTSGAGNTSALSISPSTQQQQQQQSNGAVASTTTPTTSNNGTMTGYLNKWTNYIKGYQKRWFSLSNGLLSYYRNPNEAEHTCRGTINLANANIHSDDACHFIVDNGGTHTFHLKAANEIEKQKWVSALEMAKNKAKQYNSILQQNGAHYAGWSKNANSANSAAANNNGAGGGASGSNLNDSDEDFENTLESEKIELENMLRTLQQKLNELKLSHEFVIKQSGALSKSLSELENTQTPPEDNALKTINERSTIYKIATLGLVNSCKEYIDMAQYQTERMHRVLQSERDVRSRLEDMVQEMAKQHLNIEIQLKKRGSKQQRSRVIGVIQKPPGSLLISNPADADPSQPSTLATIGSTNQADLASLSTSATTTLATASTAAAATLFTNLAVQSQQQQQQQQQQQHNQLLTTVEDATGAGELNENMANDDEFHDAVEDVTQFSVTLPRQKAAGMHYRNPSNMSKLYLQESDNTSDDEYDNGHRTIKVTMHTTKAPENAEHIDSTTTTATASTAAAVASTTTTTTATTTPAPSKEESTQKSTTTTTTTTTTTVATLGAAKPTSAALEAYKGLKLVAKKRRTQIMPRPNYSLNLWSIMKNCIGKDLTKIPLPVNFSEPISMLQRVAEELEYAQLLDTASECKDQWEQMALVAAFTVAAYSTTANRTTKPFNPLLGETYECDRLDDLGWRLLAEQVSHHPPGFAMHTESLKDWAFYQEFTLSSKFRGQYLQAIPLGTSHVEFKKSGYHYTWRKVTTFVRNIIVGKLWIDNVGEMDIINHTTKDVCHLKFFPYSYFSRDPPRKVTGIITDSNNIARYVLNGTWTEQIEGAPVLNPQTVTEQTQLNTGTSKVLWRRRYPPAILETMYNFTELTVQLNEPEEGVAPTDTRLRPDQRLMENGDWDDANREKLRLEEKQRFARRQREQAALAAAGATSGQDANGETTTSSAGGSANVDTVAKFDLADADAAADTEHTGLIGKHGAHDYEPLWFKQIIDPYTKQPFHLFQHQYWDCKMRQDWSRCPDLY